MACEWFILLHMYFKPVLPRSILENYLQTIQVQKHILSAARRLLFLRVVHNVVQSQRLVPIPLSPALDGEVS
jgi:hypothetical protein